MVLRGRLGVGACCVALVLTTGSASADWTPVAAGVEILERTDPGPNRVRAVRVDLCESGVRMRVTASNERGQRPSAWGAAVGAKVAINGGFFNAGDPTEYDSTLRGITYSGGVRWPDAQDSNRQGYVAFGLRRSTLFSEGLAPPSEPWFEEAVNGGVPILVDGVVQGDNARVPRTVVGLSQDGRYAYLVVVDGRSASSIGMTRTEIGALMLELGAYQAMNMDGGGSTAMWLAGRGLVNVPSDGSERRTLNQLGVVVDAPGPLPGRHCPWTYGAEILSAGFGPAGERTSKITLEAGDTAEVSFELKNTGEAPWVPDVTRLITTEPRDEASELAVEDWLAPSQPVAVEQVVAPGETTTLTFTVRAPETTGVYRQSFGLIQVFYAWFSESGGPAEDALTVEVTSVPVGSLDPARGKGGGLESSCAVRHGGQRRCAGRVIAGGSPWAPIVATILALTALAFRRRWGHTRDL